MSEQVNVLLANVRAETGKGPARRARRAGLVPSVMYGHGIDPVHLDLPGHEVFLIVKDSANAVVTVKYGDDNEQMCLVKSVQVHPVRRDILHVDLQVVRKGEKVEVLVPLVLIGESAAGTQHQQEEFELLVSAPATDIPETIEVDIEGLTAGSIIRVGDLKLPAGVTTEVDEARDIVSVVELSEIAEPELEEAEAEVGEATETDTED